MKENTKIALIQQHATDDVEENVRRGIENFREAAEKGADIIAFAVLPSGPVEGGG